MVAESEGVYYLPVAIGARRYRAAFGSEKFALTTLPTLRPSTDDGSEPGENSLNSEGLWARSQSNWELGAGQEFYDDEDSDRARFYQSQGVDPWTKGRLRLLNETTLLRASAEASQDLLAVGTYLFHITGQTAAFSSDGSSFTAITGLAAAAIESVASDGKYTYFAQGASGLYRVENGQTAAALFSSGAVELVAYANGRLIIANDNVLSEVNASGARTVVYTHPNTNFQWATIASAPNGIYTGGNSGDKTEWYVIGVTEATGALAAPIWCGALPDGETTNQLVFYGGMILVATSRGFRLAQIAGGGALVYGPVTEISGGIACLEPQGEDIWFGWKDFAASTSGLGRIRLAQFIDPLVAPHASDLMATVGGAVQAVVTYNSKRYFVITTSGLWAQGTNKVASGYVDSGWIRYGTTEPKVVATAGFRHDPLDGTVAIALIDEAGTTTTLGTNSTADSLGPADDYDANAAVGEMFRIKTTLTRSGSDATLDPVVRRYTAKALVAPERIDEILLTLDLATAIDNDEGTEIPLDPKAEYDFLKGLEAQGTVVTLKLGTTISYSVRVDRVRMVPHNWTDDKKFFEGQCQVRCLTVKPTAA